MGKVNKYVRAHGNSENLRIGDCFENNLFEEFQIHKKNRKENQHFKLLSAKLKKRPNSDYTPKDELEILFSENIFIDFEFAKRLQLFEIISADCFFSRNDIGEALIFLMSDNICNLRFILYEKHWETTDEISLYFEVAWIGLLSQAVLKVGKREYEVE